MVALATTHTAAVLKKTDFLENIDISLPIGQVVSYHFACLIYLVEILVVCSAFLPL
jgi:hypothetical protein